VRAFASCLTLVTPVTASENFSLILGISEVARQCNKSSLLLSIKKEKSSFLKKRSKRLLFLCAILTVRFRSEACFQVVRLIGRGEQLPCFQKSSTPAFGSTFPASPKSDGGLRYSPANSRIHQPVYPQ
jgi:hypothetical protein